MLITTAAFVGSRRTAPPAIRGQLVIRACKVYRLLMGIPGALLVCTSSRVILIIGSTPSGPQIRPWLSREVLSRVDFDSRKHEPNPCHGLNREVESKRRLIGDFRIVSSLRCPIL